MVFFELNKPTFNDLFIQFSSDSIELEGIMFVMQNLFFPPFIFKVYLITDFVYTSSNPRGHISYGLMLKLKWHPLLL